MLLRKAQIIYAPIKLRRRKVCHCIVQATVGKSAAFVDIVPSAFLLSDAMLREVNIMYRANKNL